MISYAPKIPFLFLQEIHDSSGELIALATSPHSFLPEPASTWYLGNSETLL